MVEILKLEDNATGACTPATTTFVPGGVGAATRVFVGLNKSSVMVQGDLCVEVACPNNCTPTLTEVAGCCSTNVFAGPSRLPVAKVTGGLSCGYIAGVITPSLVNVN